MSGNNEVLNQAEDMDGYALVSQLNSLRDEFINAKLNFDTQLQENQRHFKAELNKRDKQIIKLQTRNDYLEKRMGVAECVLKEHQKLIDDLEQYSRRHSLRMSGVEKKYGETSRDVAEAVSDEIDRLKLNIGPIDIDRAHRSGRRYFDKDGVEQQGVLAKFTSWYARNEFFGARKNSLYHIKADLTKQKNQTLQYARSRIHNDSLLKEFVNYVYVDPNCNLIAFTKTGRFLAFNTELDFDLLISYVDDTTRESEKVYDLIGDQFNSLFPRE